MDPIRREQRRSLLIVLRERQLALSVLRFGFWLNRHYEEKTMTMWKQLVQWPPTSTSVIGAGLIVGVVAYLLTGSVEGAIALAGLFKILCPQDAGPADQVVEALNKLPATLGKTAVAFVMCVALGALVAACAPSTSTTPPSTTVPNPPALTGAAADLQMLLGGLQQVEQNLPATLQNVGALEAAIEDIKTKAAAPLSLATAEAIAQDVQILAPAADLIPPPYGQMIAAALTLAPVIVQEAGGIGGVVAALAPAPGAMTPDEARAILRQR